MLFDNAQLEPGETVLVHAGGSGIGTIAIRIAKSIGCTVITTVGSADKAAKAAALGADHVINYREERFEGVVRKLTRKKGVDVVFEHTGADTWAGSLLSMKRGGRLVTCGATSGPTASLNLMQLFQQQYRITGSFGAPMSALARGLDRIAAGVRPVIDTVYPLEDFRSGIDRLESRDVFGKIVVEL
jgi:NADPH:quinone reductase-like Zn-dependent oxidoreductase